MAGFGEALPLCDESADMMVSYTAAPEYSQDMEMALDEAMRILRHDGVAIFGPMQRPAFKEWSGIANQALDNEQCRTYDVRVEWMRHASTGGLMEVAFTTFVK